MIEDIKKMLAPFMKEDKTAKEAEQVKEVMKYSLSEAEQNDYNRFRDAESAIDNNRILLEQEEARNQQQRMMDQMRHGQFGGDPNIQRINPSIPDPFISNIGQAGYVTYSSNDTSGGILPGGGDILSQVSYEYAEIRHLSEKDQDTYRKHLSIYLHAMDCMDKLLTGDGPKEVKKGKKIKLFE